MPPKTPITLRGSVVVGSGVWVTCIPAGGSRVVDVVGAGSSS